MKDCFLRRVLRSLSGALVVVICFGMASVFSAHQATAAVTSMITYQARLADADGNPLANGTYSMKFSIYTTSGSPATPIWTAAGTVGTPTAISVTVTSSLLTIQLGDDGSGAQNSLSTINWDQATLYLGVTIGSDSEMTPRRRITAVPQALQADNAGQLQGMYASSTASSGSSLFTIHQTQSTGATATRTALEVRSAGTSSAFDYLFRGVNDLGATVFSLNRTGAVTTTGPLAVVATGASSTFLGNVLLGTSTRDTVFSSQFSMNGDDVLVGGQLGVATSVVAMGGYYAGSATYYGEQELRSSNPFTVIATTVSSTNILVGSVTSTGSIYIGGSTASSTILGNVLLGTSTRDTVFPSGFVMDGNDTLVAGRLGVVAPVYALGGVYAGSNTFYNDNGITVSSGAFDVNVTGNTTITSNGGVAGLAFTASNATLTSAGDLRFTVPASSAIIPTQDLTALGTVSARFNGYFGYVTSTHVASTSVSSTYVTSTVVAATTINATTVNATTVSSSSITLSGATTFSGSVDSRITSGLSVSTVGTLALPSFATATNMQVVGDMLFAQTTSHLVMVDISDPSAPRTVGRYDSGGIVGGFAVQGGRFFLVADAYGERSLRVGYYGLDGNMQDISSVALPQLTQVITGVDVLVGNQAVYVVGNYDQVVIAVDVRSAASMAVKTSVTLSNRPVRSRLFGEAAIVSVMDVFSASEIHRTFITEPFALLTPSHWVSIDDGATDLFIRGRTMYVPLSTGNEVAVIDITDTGAVVTTELSGITGASRVFENGGMLFAYGTGMSGYRVFNTASSTAPSDLGTVSFASTILSFAQKGDILILGVNVATSLNFVRLPGISVNALRGGTGSFFALDTAGDLFVGGDVTIDSGLSVGLGGLSVTGGARMEASAATGSVLSVVNRANANQHKSWGVYTNRLLVGENANATGTNSYVSLFGYNSGASRFGICLDNTNTASTCIDFASTSTVYSLLADDAIGANAFDLAERYHITGEAEPGDVLVLDPETPLHMKKSTGTTYDSALSGVVSTRPGFILGTGGDVSVALVGRVPVKVTVANGAIAPGDPLTSSEVPGIAMKATRAGRIIGRALEGATADGLIEVYLQPGFDASTLLRADGSLTTIAQDLGVRSTGTASQDAPTFNSQVLSFLGSAWDGSGAVASEFRLFNQVTSATSSALTIATASSTLFSVDAQGSVSITGDLALAGRLYPSARGVAQRESYIFVDDTSETGNYISTNADGWQSQDGYDYAERYVSPDELEAGDVVTVRRGSRLYVQRTLKTEEMVVGVVSTKPGFIAGRPQEDAYPIALAGRVPTKVSTINGAIEAGDSLAPSTIPGVAVKATAPGPTIGLALEAYSGSDVGRIEVFVNPGWYGGYEQTAANEGAVVAGGIAKSGFAQILVGQSRVRVSLTGFIRYPHLQVTPYTQVESGWWIDRVTPEGFDVVLGAPIGRAARFAWTAEEVGESPTILLSSGSRFSMDPVSGEVQFPPAQDESTPPPKAISEDPAPEPTPLPEGDSAEESQVNEPPVPGSASAAEDADPRENQTPETPSSETASTESPNPETAPPSESQTPEVVSTEPIPPTDTEPT